MNRPAYITEPAPKVEFFEIRNGRMVKQAIRRNRNELSLDALLGRLERDSSEPDPAATAAWDRAWNGR